MGVTNGVSRNNKRVRHYIAYSLRFVVQLDCVMVSTDAVFQEVANREGEEIAKR